MDLIARAMAASKDIVYTPDDLQAQILFKAQGLTTLHDFETDVTQVKGVVAYDTTHFFSGSRSLSLTTSEADSYGSARIDLGMPVDLSDKTLVIMGYRPSGQAIPSKLRLTLMDESYAILDQRTRSFSGPLYKSEDRWEVIPFAVPGSTPTAGNTRYIDVYTEYIGAPTTLFVDKLMAVPKRSKGAVTFTLDGGYIGQYTRLKPLLDAKGYRAVIYPAKEYIDLNPASYLTMAQLHSLQSLGWDVGIHTGPYKLLSDMTVSELKAVAIDRQAWLRHNGFKRGGRFLVGLQDSWSLDAVQVMEDYFWFLRAGSGIDESAIIAALPVFNPSNMFAIAGNYDVATQIAAVEKAATYKQWCVLIWHQPDREGELSLVEMGQVIDRVAELGLDVLTLSDVCDEIGIKSY